MDPWYGQSATKQQLEQLIEKKPKLMDLFSQCDLLQQLKSFNPKLLDYVSSTPQLVKQIISYLTVEPSQNDTNQRKYKYPLLAIETIQTQTTCILNTFFKENKDTKGFYFDDLFKMLNDKEVLPLLAGYFFRVNLCLINNRLKDAVDRVYSNPLFFEIMINHSYLMPISNTIQLYLNLDVNKYNPPEKLSIKSQTLTKIISKISSEFKSKNLNSSIIIQNLTNILIQTIQKYYLIVDGKQMMEIITGNYCIQVMMNLLKDNTQLAYSAMSFFITLINYYSFSSLNAQQGPNSELYRKNLERLQNQPMIVSINNYYPMAMQKIQSLQILNLHAFKLLQVLCHMISISSYKILGTIKTIKFFPSLINLLFKHQQCSILHMLIQKAFLHIFISQRTFYQQYKQHLFCDIDIIDLTASRFLKMFPQDNIINLARNKGYFGHFMRILKIYSGIQTTDQKIIQAIKSKTQIWNKISKILIKPYQTICYKDLGSYNDIPQPTVLQFKIKKTNNQSLQSDNTTIIQQIKIQQQLQNFKTLQNTDSKKKQQQGHSPFKNSQEIFKIPSHGLLQSNDSQKQLKKSQSFKQFMNKKKVQAQNQIRMKRSMSTQRKLSSGQRNRITSPSPRKKNSWKQSDQQQTKPQPIPKQQINKLPKIPTNTINKKNLTNSSTLVQRTNNHVTQKISQSMVNLQDLKKIRVIQIDKPTQKKYRRIQDKDKVLLDFLGIAY